MNSGLAALIRTTTFRLALAQAGLVLAFVVSLLIYIYFATAGQLLRDSDTAADQEFASLERAYGEGGMRRLNQEVVERAARQGPMLYLLADVDSRVITGDFQSLPALPGETSMRVDFGFDRDGGQRGRARGRIGRVLNGPILLVARDLGDSAVIAGRITRALWTVAIMGLAISVAAGLLAAWQAARRVEAISNTAHDVIKGDLTRRAPVRGGGDEFDSLALAMNDMLDRLERLVHTTRTAGDAIAHDLRSPLARFRRRLDVALEAPPNSDADRQALQKAAEEGDRLLGMFNAVLMLSRVEAASTWKFEDVDVTEIMEELVEFYEAAAELRGHVFTAEVAKGLAVRGDAGLVTQAVANLIENALKYTPEGGRIDVRAVLRPDRRVELTVSDDGPGIPVQDRERVLERFVRLEDARTTPGVGLGLSLVSAVARVHKGGLHLRNGLGGRTPGLSAAFVLPAINATQ